MHEILLAYVFEKNFKNCMRSQNFIIDKIMVTIYNLTV